MSYGGGAMSLEYWYERLEELGKADEAKRLRGMLPSAFWPAVEQACKAANVRVQQLCRKKDPSTTEMREYREAQDLVSIYSNMLRNRPLVSS